MTDELRRLLGEATSLHLDRIEAYEDYQLWNPFGRWSVTFAAGNRKNQVALRDLVRVSLPALPLLLDIVEAAREVQAHRAQTLSTELDAALGRLDEALAALEGK